MELLTTYTFSSFPSYLSHLYLHLVTHSLIHFCFSKIFYSYFHRHYLCCISLCIYLHKEERAYKHLCNAKLCIWQWHQNYVTYLFYTLIWNSFHSFLFMSSSLHPLHCSHLFWLALLLSTDASNSVLSYMIVLWTLFHDISFFFVHYLCSWILRWCRC